MTALRCGAAPAGKSAAAPAATPCVGQGLCVLRGMLCLLGACPPGVVWPLQFRQCCASVAGLHTFSLKSPASLPACLPSLGARCIMHVLS